MADDTLGPTVKRAREANLLGNNHFENFIGIFMHEWASTHHHLIDENTQAVPINSFPMAFIEYDLWGQVFRSAAEGISSFSWHQLLDKAKVRELEVTRGVYQDIFWL